MIVDKNTLNKNTLPADSPKEESPIQEPWEVNPMAEIYEASARILREIPKDPKDPDGPKFFKTVKLNQGQLSKIKHDKHNYEYGLAFPAAFVHLINVRWLVQTSRIGEGRGEMRICYVLNRLNTLDDPYQTEGMHVFKRIVEAFNERRSEFPAFTERLQLTYWDQVENFDDGLQQYWITYEVWFKDYTEYIYKNYVDKYVVIPPFTNHSDQLPEIQPEDHGDHFEDDPDDVATIGP